MRILLSAAAIVAFSITSFGPAEAAPPVGAMKATPAEASVQFVGHYYGHPVRCWWKKVRRYDAYGNLVIRRVKVCR